MFVVSVEVAEVIGTSCHCNCCCSCDPAGAFAGAMDGDSDGCCAGGALPICVAVPLVLPSTACVALRSPASLLPIAKGGVPLLADGVRPLASLLRIMLAPLAPAASPAPCGSDMPPVCKDGFPYATVPVTWYYR